MNERRHCCQVEAAPSRATGSRAALSGAGLTASPTNVNPPAATRLMMHVHLFATLRAAAGQKVVELPLPPGATVQTLLDTLLAHFPALRPLLLEADGALFSYVHLFVNGRDVQYLPQGPQTPLRQEDQVSVFPAVGGG